MIVGGDLVESRHSGDDGSGTVVMQRDGSDEVVRMIRPRAEGLLYLLYEQ